ncbi:MAG: Rieske 2Fe-2S domain-containing protein [Deltaproteobacteria bacterium]|nr:MAG: Rieske 2Fe-2S domain-containing protein [Deltaproteobacteria bacterium]
MISTPGVATAAECIGRSAPTAMLAAMAELTSVAVYRRRIGASLERVWENVRDWEHLPWLHRDSFASIDLEHEDERGWRARVGLRAPANAVVRLELAASDDRRYVARTLEGPGADTEIWTRLDPIDAHRTGIEVEFLVPDMAAGRRDALGAAYVALYTRLWDQDEAMMQRRSFLLDAPRAPRAARTPVDLGPAAELEARLPLRVSFAGRPVVVARCDGELLAYDALCPHALGPLDAAPLSEDGRVVCPWHGKAFDVHTGRDCEAVSRLRLFLAPRVEVAGGRVRLVTA